MQVSCNTFETFVRHPLSELPWFWRAQLPPLPNPVDPGPGTQPVQLQCDVCGEFSTHLRLVTSISLHCGTKWRGDTSTILNSQLSQLGTHVSSIRPYAQGRFRPIPVFCRDRQLSSPCRHLLPINSVSNSYFFIKFSSATSDLHVVLCTANHPRTRREECSEFHVETPHDGQLTP